MSAPSQKVESYSLYTCPLSKLSVSFKSERDHTRSCSSSRLRETGNVFWLRSNEESSTTEASTIAAGGCPSTVDVRLLSFWEIRNVKCGGELMGLTCSSLKLR
ncbi:hypothetical protein IGI04_015269 [Brassica rapa subsp. trilocularis]|uniref:Uncharacterized protein n=1 Tax=Brassica rapa subsp. trilocularis TaxID=1813537 RepID=A0ABQ7MPP1_BRACM|nr:hypothetical protein IGI04_015269 [Brassica rapa subsp. trilocularis]